jgi:hypothetical protein
LRFASRKVRRARGSKKANRRIFGVNWSTAVPASCDVKAVIAVVSNPIDKRDGVIVTEGWYTRDGDLITMTDIHGEPLRNEDTGARFTQRLEPGQDAVGAAKRLVMRRYRAERGDEMADFHSRPLRYPDRGWA